MLCLKVHFYVLDKYKSCVCKVTATESAFQNIFDSRPHSKIDARANFILVEASSLCCLIQFDHLVLRHAVEVFSE